MTLKERMWRAELIIGLLLAVFTGTRMLKPFDAAIADGWDIFITVLVL
jgi:hypothetical protein